MMCNVAVTINIVRIPRAQGKYTQEAIDSLVTGGVTMQQLMLKTHLPCGDKQQNQIGKPDGQ